MRKEIVQKEEICFPNKRYEEIKFDGKQRISEDC